MVSQFSGKQDFSGPLSSGGTRRNKGVMKARRAVKRAEAEERNARTPFERTARYRREAGVSR